MGQKDLLLKLKKMGIHSKTHFYSEAFSRNIGLLTTAEQLKLSEAKIAIPGMGGVGGVHLMTMIRSGIGQFHLADFDTFEVANFNRQFGATVETVGRSKLEAMTAQALSVNPHAAITPFPEGITPANLDDFLDGVHVVLDSLDFFEFDIRRMLFNRAREKGVYVVTAGPMGYSAAMLVFSPHEGMGFDDYFNIIENMKPQDQYLSYAMGLSPRPTHIKYMDLDKVDLNKKAGPSLNIACQLCSAMAGSEAIRIILKKGKVKPVPHYFQFDPFLQKYRKGRLWGGNRHPLQKAKLFIVQQLLKRNKNNIKQQEPEIPKTRMNADRIPASVRQYILEAGIQAPSGDNAQPWKFRISENTISLYLDRHADTSFFNINQIASMISCGAVLENMRMAATLFGLEAKIDMRVGLGKKDFIADTTLTDTGCESDPLARMIWQRQTNRKFYRNTPISDADRNTVITAASHYPGARLHLLTDSGRVKALARLVYQVDRIRTEHRSLHEHLNKMIRFTRKEALWKKDGLPLKNLEAGIAGEYFLKITRPWFIMNLMNKLGMGKLVALHSYQGITRSAGVGLLTIDGVDSADFVRGGQALEHIWLTFSRLGLALQPMTAITLFWHRWLLGSRENFQPSHREMLTRVWETYHRLFSGIDFNTEGQVMLFRFGAGDTIKTGTYRKNTDKFILPQ